MRTCVNQQENLKDCPCTYEPCERKGICCECIKYHLSSNELPACCFSPEVEKTYDRSFAKFVSEWQNGKRCPEELLRLWRISPRGLRNRKLTLFANSF